MVARKTLPSSRTQHERLLSLIRANPGIHVRRLAQLVGLSWNTCLHHLRTMEAQDRVVSRKVQGRVCYFDRTRGAVDGKEALCLLRDPDNRRLVQRILEEPGRKQVEIAKALSMPTSTVHRRVARMEAAGLIRRMHESRSMLVFPSERLGALGGAQVPADDPFGAADAPLAPRAGDATEALADTSF